MNSTLLTQIATLLEKEETDVLLILRPAPSLWPLVKHELSRRNPLEMVLALFSHQKINWVKISSSSHLNSKLISKYEDKLNWKYVSRNPVIRLLDLEAVTYYENKYGCSLGQVANLQLVHNLPHKPWTKEEVSFNRTITAELIEKYPDAFDWKSLLTNPALPVSSLIKRIEDGRFITEDWDKICANPVFTPKLIRRYNEEVNRFYLSPNESLTPRLIIKYDKDWNWSVMSENKALTAELIYKYRYSLNWTYVSRNPSLTPELVRRFDERLEWSYLSSNPVMANAELIKKYFIADAEVSKEKQWHLLSWNCLENNPKLILDNLDWPWDFTR